MQIAEFTSDTDFGPTRSFHDINPLTVAVATGEGVSVAVGTHHQKQV